MSGYAQTQNAGMRSSLKFSYWSSPQITTTSGAKASSSARTRSSPATRAARWAAAAVAPLSVPHSARIASGQLAGSFSAAGMAGSSMVFSRMKAICASGTHSGG